MKNGSRPAHGGPDEKKISWAESNLAGLTLSEARRRVRERAKRAFHERGDWRASPLPENVYPADRTVGTFDSRADWDEPSSFGLPASLKTAYPRIDGEHLRFHVATPAELIGEGIKEPALGLPTAHPKLLLVPALMADREGRRIGRGRGYYDRYLSTHAETHAVAVVHSDYVFDRLPEAWLHAGDQPVQGLLTESHFYDFGTFKE